MIKLNFLFIAVLALVACEKGSEPTNKAIEVESGQTTQVISAEATEGKGGVTFKTTGAWTSIITEDTTAKSTPDWVHITPESGNAAGTYTVNMTLLVNPSNEKRTATITLHCSDDKVTLTITQEGKTEPETTPKVISGIERTGDRDKVTFTFNYDEKGRITEYLIKNWKMDYTYEASFSYNIAGEVRVKFDSDTDNWIAYLNADGYANKIHKSEYQSETDYSIIYSNGYLSEESWRGYDDKAEVNYYSWEAGNFWKSWHEVEEWSYEEMANIIVPKNLVEYTSYTTIANDKSNIDLNMLLQTVGGRNGSCNGEKYSSDTYNRDCMDVLSLFGFLGKRSTYLIKEFPKVYETVAPISVAKAAENFAIPVADYTLNSDNQVTKIVYRVAFANDPSQSTTDTYTISYK